MYSKIFKSKYFLLFIAELLKKLNNMEHYSLSYRQEICIQTQWILP